MLVSNKLHINRLIEEVFEGYSSDNSLFEDRIPYGYWTYERCKEEAAKYKNRKAFERGNNNAYRAALRKGWLDEFYGESTRHESGYWTYERCKEEASKYKTRKAFQIGNGAAHYTTRKNGWLDEFFPKYENNIQNENMNTYTSDEMLNESVSDVMKEVGKFAGKSMKDLIRFAIKLLKRYPKEAIIIGLCGALWLTAHQKHQLQKALDQYEIGNNIENVENICKGDKPTISFEERAQSNWKLICTDCTATVYNAVANQCNSDVVHTASMFKLNLKHVGDHKIIAMERTMMAEYGLKYGDVVKIEGAGSRDGVYQIQDTMNKRFKGQHKIDILVPNDVKLGHWDNVRVYKLQDKDDYTDYYKQGMLADARVKK